MDTIEDTIWVGIFSLPANQIELEGHRYAADYISKDTARFIMDKNYVHPEYGNDPEKRRKARLFWARKLLGCMITSIKENNLL